MNEDKLREEIKNIFSEIIFNDEKINEFDIVAKNKKDWNEMKGEIKNNLSDLLRYIEHDEYKKGGEKITTVIGLLMAWKKKIEKTLS